jgi:signal transduction histidine kinase
LPPTTFIHPDSLHLYSQYLQTVRAGGDFHTQARQVRKDGTPFPIEVHGTTFMYQGKRRGLGVVRDITEQVQAYQLLERRVAERTRELSTLLEVSHNVASTLDLKPLLGLILAQLKTVVDYTGAAIFIVEGEHGRVLDYRGPLPSEQMLDLRIPLAQAAGYQAVLHHDGPVIIDDLWDDSPLAQAFQGMPAQFKATVEYARSVLVVPLKAMERLIGVVRIDHCEPRSYTPQHAKLALAIASQAAMAIEHARLYARAQDTATLEERQRLARELHDSVTQALYGVTLYAEAAASVLAAGDQETATTYLHEVRNTAQEALQEMRLLIFELRPPILEQEGLAAALQARLTAVEGRTAGLTTRSAVDADLRLPARVEEALYRIAQEALNNVLKHARARTVALALRRDGPTVTLEIADDGTGFVPATAGRRGGVGLHGMRERAVLIGAHLTIQSTPGLGTVVRVEVPHE